MRKAGPCSQEPEKYGANLGGKTKPTRVGPAQNIISDSVDGIFDARVTTRYYEHLPASPHSYFLFGSSISCFFGESLRQRVPSLLRCKCQLFHGVANSFQSMRAWLVDDCTIHSETLLTAGEVSLHPCVRLLTASWCNGDASVHYVRVCMGRLVYW